MTNVYYMAILDVRNQLDMPRDHSLFMYQKKND